VNSLAAILFVAPLCASAAAAQPSAAQSFEGTLLIVWGDPHANSSAAGEISYTLALPDGRQVPLQMAGLGQAALSYFGKPVVVTGNVAASPASVAGASASQMIVVDSIGPSRSSLLALDRNVAQAVSGSRRVIVSAPAFSIRVHTGAARGGAIDRPARAALNIARGDDAALYGARYTNSGYTLNVNAAAAGLTPGVYNLVVWAHSTATGAFNNFAVVRLTIQ
jgi:hypothetical protein